MKGRFNMLVERVRTEMVNALKSGEKEKKTILSLLVAALDKGAKEKKSDLTTDEENQIVLKMCKQIQETIDSCPVGREDIKSKAELELSVISQFAPKMMDESEICGIIEDVVKELGCSLADIKTLNKGQVMKLLMPRVKGRADGKQVNQLVERYFK